MFKKKIGVAGVAGGGENSKKWSQRGERAYRALHTGPGKDVGSYSQWYRSHVRKRMVTLAHVSKDGVALVERVNCK